jgi:ATP synthase protein I
MADPETPSDRMIREVSAKQSRMLRARAGSDSFWSALELLGVVGWSVVVPTLLGVALGIFIDRRWPGRFSWTLMLLFAGLVFGCVNAWQHIRGNEGGNHK